jgi:hypothetical protein
MKVLIVVICCDDARGEYRFLSDTIKKTWGTINNPEAEVHYVWCNNYKKAGKNDFVIDYPESYAALLWKTLWFLKSKINEDFDYIYRTNVGCYVHVDRLVAHLQNCPRKKFYSGPVGEYLDHKEKITFVSGTGFILSKDLCVLMVKKIKDFRDDHIDDVAIGRFLVSENGIQPTPDFSRRIYDGHDFGCDTTYQFKLRSPDGTRDADKLAMIDLHKRFYP